MSYMYTFVFMCPNLSVILLFLFFALFSFLFFREGLSGGGLTCVFYYRHTLTCENTSFIDILIHPIHFIFLMFFFREGFSEGGAYLCISL